MRIVHFSDWHWSFHALPEADLYVCTGDMYDNYPVPTSSYSRWRIDPIKERMAQLDAARELSSQGGFRKLLGSPEAPIVCVRGNHDFADLAPLFVGCNLVHEFIDNEVIEVLGKRVTGHRGIPWICGTWSDEVMREELLERVRGLPNADIFLTHYPPLDVLDHEFTHDGFTSYGLHDMRQELEGRMGDRGLHCFGHIHGCGGMTEEFGPGRLIGTEGPLYTYSNAACNTNVIDV